MANKLHLVCMNENDFYNELREFASTAHLPDREEIKAGKKEGEHSHDSTYIYAIFPNGEELDKAWKLLHRIAPPSVDGHVEKFDHTHDGLMAAIITRQDMAHLEKGVKGLEFKRTNVSNIDEAKKIFEKIALERAGIKGVPGAGAGKNF